MHRQVVPALGPVDGAEAVFPLDVAAGGAGQEGQFVPQDVQGRQAAVRAFAVAAGALVAVAHAQEGDRVAPQSRRLEAAVELVAGLREGLGARELLPPGGKERHRRLVQVGVLLAVVLVHLRSDGGDRVEVPPGAGESVQCHERTVAADDLFCAVAGEFQHGAGQCRVVLAHDAHLQYAVPRDGGVEREDHA
ncbi:hypothetical protein CG747_41235 [Streptomyces sp. CB02959]|nr:hypothetical protein CG747_41235 [Streptomyces sp. CB02959]